MVKEKKVVKKETTKKEEKNEKVNKVVKGEKKSDIKNKETKKTTLGHKTTLKSEFNKIKWPTKKEMIKYSIATIVFIIFFALFFFAINLIMAFLKEIV